MKTDSFASSIEQVEPYTVSAPTAGMTSHSWSPRLMLTTRDRYIAMMRSYAMALSQSSVIEADRLNNWADRGLEKLEEQGRLVTEAQYQDHRARRILQVGDRSKYIGPERSETLSDGLVVMRPHGQTGAVVHVKAQGAQSLITFRPDANALTTRIVDLVVLSNTRGYFQLERLLR